MLPIPLPHSSLQIRLHPHWDCKFKHRKSSAFSDTGALTNLNSERNSHYSPTAVPTRKIVRVRSTKGRKGMGNPKHQEKIVGKGMRTRVNEEQQCRLPRAEQSDEIRNPQERRRRRRSRGSRRKELTRRWGLSLGLQRLLLHSGGSRAAMSSHGEDGVKPGAQVAHALI